MGLAERLHRKGWDAAEIDHAVTHMKLTKQRQPDARRVIEEGIYWLNMFILAVANVAITWFLFPFLSYLPRTLSITIAAVLGIVWGVLFGHLGHEIARLEPHRHVFVLFVAALTVAFTAIAVGAFNVVLSIVFCGVFVAYYALLWWRRGS